MNNIFENCIHQFITHLQERKPCEVFGMDELTREKCWIQGPDLRSTETDRKDFFFGTIFFRQSFLIFRAIEIRTCWHSVQNTDETKYFTLNASTVCVDKRSTGKLYMGVLKLSYGSKLGYLGA